MQDSMKRKTARHAQSHSSQDRTKNKPHSAARQQGSKTVRQRQQASHTNSGRVPSSTRLALTAKAFQRCPNTGFNPTATAPSVSTRCVPASCHTYRCTVRHRTASRLLCAAHASAVSAPPRSLRTHSVRSLCKGLAATSRYLAQRWSTEDQALPSGVTVPLAQRGGALCRHCYRLHRQNCLRVASFSSFSLSSDNFDFLDEALL